VAPAHTDGRPAPPDIFFGIPAVFGRLFFWKFCGIRLCGSGRIVPAPEQRRRRHPRRRAAGHRDRQVQRSAERAPRGEI